MPSDGSEDFLPFAKDQEANFSSDEALMLREMELEGAEDAADEEELEDEDITQGDSEQAESEDEEGSESGASELEGKSRTAWGRKAKDFYGGSSSGESSEGEEEMKHLVTEAVRVTEVEDVEGIQEEHFGADPRVLEGLRKLLDMQGKVLPTELAAEKKGDDQEVLWQARLDAEVCAILDGFSSSSNRQQPKAHAATAGLTDAELQQLVSSAHPELQGLLQELRDALVEVKEKVWPLVGLARGRKLFTKEGLSLLDTKNQLLLSYLSYLSYYVLLKAHGIPIASHPVVERLIESRLLLQKLRPVEATLKPQLDKLIQMAREGPKAAAATARARPDSFAAVGHSEGEDDTDASSLDGDDDEDGSGSEQEHKTQAYKAPKMLAMEYTGDRVPARTRAVRELQRAAARLQKSELVRSFREMTGDAPEEVGIERWLAARARSATARQCGSIGESRISEDDEELGMVKRSLSKKERKAQAAQRSLFDRRSAAALGSILEDLAMFADQPISLEEDAFDTTAGPLKRARAKGALSHYLNAAKQVANEAATVQKANARKLVISRQQNSQHFSRRQDTGRPTPRVPAGDEEGDKEFEEMAGELKKRKEERKKRMQDKAKQFLPQLEEEVRGQRAVTRQIEKNIGLTRKRKKFEGNARLHNRMKFQQKSKKLKSMRPDMRAVEDRSYEGEATGLRANLKKSRTLH